MSDLVTGTAENGVLTVTLRRPEKRNAMNQPLIAALGDCFTMWSTRDDIALAVLTGEGDKAFASGGDLKELAVIRSEADTLAFAAEFRAALDTIRRFPVPVIAAINGDALGGGAELVLACDMRFAAVHARIGFLQARLNIPTAWGGGGDLLNLLGPSRALMLLCGAEALPAGRALAAGLVDAVAPDGTAFAVALHEFIAPFASRPAQVMRAFKSLAAAHKSGSSTAGMAELETRNFARCWIHPDHWHAVEAMFKPQSQPP